MLVLGLESSCDETAAAIVEDGHRVRSELVASQAQDFAKWGGVVPEIAARGHVAWMPGLALEAMSKANCTLQDLDAIAVSAWPGLMGSLLIGVTAAKVFAARRGCPLIAVDHVEAHLAAIHLERPEVHYPMVALVASGGHSHFYHLHAPGQMKLLGGTIDDAAGEAFDKAAAILGLGYPGGPAIDALAENGDPKAISLPRSLLHSDDLRLSFAGLKTALLYQVRGPLGKDPLTLSPQGLKDAAASFQAAVVDILCAKMRKAAKNQGVNSIAIGGGVACNRGLRTGMQHLADTEGWTLLMPKPSHCADNAAMIAALGCLLAKTGRNDPLRLSARPMGSAREGKFEGLSPTERPIHP